MSNTNTTLATLAGGFVPMLLKNVLSSKGARLSLKTVSFKGQIDEIIGEYKQFWPLTDFLFSRRTPGEDEDGEEGKKDDLDGQNEAEKMGKSGEEKSKNPNPKNPDNKNKDDYSEENEKKRPDNGKSDDKKPQDDQSWKEDKRNGIICSVSGMGSNKSTEGEDYVDLFIDLSVADAAGWSIYGSSESLPSESIMPGYFDPAKYLEDDRETQPTQPLEEETPPKYLREVLVTGTHHKKSSV